MLTDLPPKQHGRAWVSMPSTEAEHQREITRLRMGVTIDKRIFYIVQQIGFYKVQQLINVKKVLIKSATVIS